jgi:hypothetical protein
MIPTYTGATVMFYTDLEEQSRTGRYKYSSLGRSDSNFNQLMLVEVSGIQLVIEDGESRSSHKTWWRPASKEESRNPDKFGFVTLVPDYVT